MNRFVFVITLVFVLTSGVVIGIHYEEYNNAKQKAKENMSAGVEESPKWTDITITWFTLVLTAATLIQVVLWVQGNSIAKRSVAVSEKSMSVFIASERGRLLFENCSFVEEGKGLSYEFKNVGRSAIVIESIGIRFRPMISIGEIKPVGNYIRDRYPSGTPVIGGGVYKYWTYIPTYCFINEGPAKGELDDEWIVQFSILYSTMGIRTHYWCNWGWYQSGSMKLVGGEYEREDDIGSDWPTKAVIEAELPIEAQMSLLSN
jgi:hypothetical protein